VKEEQLTDDIKDLLGDARDSLGAAKSLIKDGYPGFAAARAYFAMFYIAEAFLESKGLSFSKHSAVISAFGSQFVKTGLVEQEYHRYLIDAQEVRLEGDYPKLRNITFELATKHIERAEKFLKMAEAKLKGA
jgi:uncharacterized protein (UPF0332 family)